MFSFFKPVPSISPEDLQSKINAKDAYTLIDVRTEGEYSQGHIHGSTLIPLDILSSEIRKAVPDKSQEIFVNCRSGGRSTQAVHMLNDLGYTNVINVTGGIMAWSGAGYPLER